MDWKIYIRFLSGKLLFADSGLHEREHILKLDLKRRGHHGEGNRLEQLLEDFQGCQCQEQRDKIFAFLGLALDSSPLTAD